MASNALGLRVRRLWRASRTRTEGRAVHPVILGAGTPFLPALDDRLGLKLLETRTFGSGVVYLRYETVSPA